MAVYKLIQSLRTQAYDRWNQHYLCHYTLTVLCHQKNENAIISGRNMTCSYVMLVRIVLQTRLHFVLARTLNLRVLVSFVIVF